MSSTQKWLILIILASGAFASYGVGFSAGLWAFVILGGLFEMSFWAGLLTLDED